MKVLITGVTGRIGANLAAALMKKGYQVRGLVMPNDPNAEKAAKLGVEVYEADMGDAEALHRAVEGVDKVAHLAAQMIQGATSSERMFVINALGTLSLLEAAAKSSRPISRFLYAGTDQAYHPFASGATFYEDHLQKPRDIYGLGKYVSEQACFEYMREYGLPITIVRYSSVKAGDEALKGFTPQGMKRSIETWSAPGRIPWFGAEKVAEALDVISRVVEQQPDAALGLTGPDGTPWALPYTDVRDSVAGTVLALESDNAIGEAFNIVAAFSTPLTVGAKLVSEHTDRPYKELRMPFLWSFYNSIEKARALLGYQPQYDYPKMVESALAFLRGEDIGIVPT